MSNNALVYHIRDLIRCEGPISFARFMEEALYHPEHGYYSTDRCAIGRGGDYFTSVSVGPLFGRFMAAQFAEVWEKLRRPDDFVIVEQGAHHGEFAGDVLESLRAHYPGFFSVVHYWIVEPFPVLRRRQEGVLRQFAQRVHWTESLDALAPFCGVHFSNELVDAMPVHLIVSVRDREALRWCERRVERTSCGFTFVAQPIESPELQSHLARIPTPPSEGYETEVNLAALSWIETLAEKLKRGVILVADYGLTRAQFYAPSRRTGTLQSYASQRVLTSPFEEPGESDLTTHVDWTSLAERAAERGLTIAGFTDQHHFLTGLLAARSELTSLGEKAQALQTLLHPEFLGTRFQFLGLTKHFPDAASLAGFKFAREPREKLGLAGRETPSS